MPDDIVPVLSAEKRAQMRETALWHITARGGQVAATHVDLFADWIVRLVATCAALEARAERAEAALREIAGLADAGGEDGL